MKFSRIFPEKGFSVLHRCRRHSFPTDYSRKRLALLARFARSEFLDCCALTRNGCAAVMPVSGVNPFLGRLALKQAMLACLKRSFERQDHTPHVEKFVKQD